MLYEDELHPVATIIASESIEALIIVRFEFKRNCLQGIPKFIKYVFYNELPNTLFEINNFEILLKMTRHWLRQLSGFN